MPQVIWGRPIVWSGRAQRIGECHRERVLLDGSAQEPTNEAHEPARLTIAEINDRTEHIYAIRFQASEHGSRISDRFSHAAGPRRRSPVPRSP